MKLSENNKKRHANSIRRLLLSNQTRILTEHFTESRNRNALLPKIRIGTSKTTDGAGFVLTDEKKIGKIIYYTTERQLDQIFTEYRIGKFMGEHDIGPKVYNIFFIETNRPNLASNNMLSQSRLPGKTAAIIVMENLAYNAKLVSLDEWVKKLKQPYPLAQVDYLHKKMEKLGILHGDLHANNILIQIRNDGTFRVYFIDYGRSMFKNPNIDANVYLKSRGGKSLNTHPGYYSLPGLQPVSVNRRILKRNYNMYDARTVVQKQKTPSPSPSPPKGIRGKLLVIRRNYGEPLMRRIVPILAYGRNKAVQLAQLSARYGKNKVPQVAQKLSQLIKTYGKTKVVNEISPSPPHRNQRQMMMRN